MKITFASTLLPLAASAAVLRRDEDWSQYDGTTGILKSDGLCRYYLSNNPPAQAAGGADMCNDFCQPARELTSEDAVFSVSCFGDTAKGTPTFTDPAGAQYHMGQCKCNDPVVNFIGETFVEALPAVGKVTCAVWKLATSEAAKLIAGAPFTASSGTQVLIKTAKTVAKLGQSQTKWEEWVRRVSEDNACDFSPQQLFKDFTGLSDEDIQNVL